MRDHHHTTAVAPSSRYSSTVGGGDSGYANTPGQRASVDVTTLSGGRRKTSGTGAGVSGMAVTASSGAGAAGATAAGGVARINSNAVGELIDVLFFWKCHDLFLVEKEERHDMYLGQTGKDRYCFPICVIASRCAGHNRCNQLSVVLSLLELGWEPKTMPNLGFTTQ